MDCFFLLCLLAFYSVITNQKFSAIASLARSKILLFVFLFYFFFTLLAFNSVITNKKKSSLVRSKIMYFFLFCSVFFSLSFLL